MNVNRQEPLGWLAKVYGSAAEGRWKEGDVRVTPVERPTRPSVKVYGAEEWLTDLYRKTKPQIQVH